MPSLLNQPKCKMTKHDDHVAAHHCADLMRFCRELCSYLGPQQSFTISMDDNDGIKLGVTRINEQAKVIMSLDH